MYLSFLFILFLVLLNGRDAKTVSGRFHLEAGDQSHGPEYEITKFSFAIGVGTVEGKFIYQDSKNWMTSPALYLFMDENWDKYHSAPSCMDKVEHASASIPIGSQTRSHHDILKDHFGQATTSNTRNLKDNKVEWTFTWKINHETRTHGWFIVAADCALEQYNAKVTPMEYTVSLINPDNTHLPADEFGLPRFYVAVFVLMTLYFLLLGRIFYQTFKVTKDAHLIVLLLMFAYGLQYMSIIYELIHLSVYKYNGYGILFADYFSEILEGLSQTVLAFVLICLASGWTLVDLENNKARGNSIGTLLANPGKLLDGPNAVVFIIIAFVVIAFILQVWNKAFDDDFKKFHDHETLPGKILLFLRFSLGLFFVYSFHVTIKIQQSRGGDKLLAFLKRLRSLGGLWFLSFPVVVFVAEMFPHYLRHRIVSTGVISIQTLCLGTLGYQFINESSTYHKLSTLADAGVLPGAGGLVRAPKPSND